VGLFTGKYKVQDLEERIDGHARPTGHARVLVNEELSSAQRAEREYQYRVDHGVWHTWVSAAPDGAVLVEDGHLMLTGDHEIELRSRFKDDYQSLDPTPVVVQALTDTVPPEVDGALELDHVAVSVSDVGSRPALLKLVGRFDRGEWFDIPLGAGQDTASAAVPLAGVSAHVLELVAIDGRNNRSPIKRVVVGSGLVADTTPEPSAQGCACSTSGSGPGLELAALAAAGLLYRRRRRA
jgi:MYXO-CTERM domain-containing protein